MARRFDTDSPALNSTLLRESMGLQDNAQTNDATIYFDDYGKKKYSINKFLVNDLKAILSSLTNTMEYVTDFYVYRNPRRSNQLFYNADKWLWQYEHRFVVLTTDKGVFWSLERKAEGVTMQRSEGMLQKEVIYKYRRNERLQNSKCPIEQISHFACPHALSMTEVFSHIWETHLFQDGYHTGTNNSHHFAKKIGQFFKREPVNELRNREWVAEWIE